jgi:PAS domain S-box-containing protein
MTSANHEHHWRMVRQRREEIAEQWYRAVARSSFIPRSGAEVRPCFSTLTEQSIDLLLAEPFDRQQAQIIGATLARLGYAHPETLGRTLEVLTHHLLAGVPPSQCPALHSRLTLLLSEMAIGFTRQVRATVLAEQEQLRNALIEQRKRTEAALGESEHRVRMVVTNVPVVLFALDGSGVVTLTQGKGLAALGLTPEAVVGQSVLDLTSTTPQMVDNIQRALAGEAFTDIVDVEALVFETRYAPLRDGQDQVVGVIGVALDITERRQVQAELETLRSRSTPMSAAPLSGHEAALSLTSREWDVLQLIVAGKMNREMALALSISSKTVEKHISSLYTKLGVHSRVELITWALRHSQSERSDSAQR